MAAPVPPPAAIAAPPKPAGGAAAEAAAAAAAAADEENAVPKNPDLSLVEKVFLLSRPESLVPPSQKDDVKRDVLEAITKDNMAPYYSTLCERLKWPVNQALLATMQAANAGRLAQLDAAIADAAANLGESELREAHLAKAEYLLRIGDKAAALAAYRVTYEKTVALGQRLDILFAQIRLGFFWGDVGLVVRTIERTRLLVDEGGDWDRRNRLKVYDALHQLSVRNFRRAAQLLLETLSTFTSTELFSYKQFILYTVLVAVLTSDRPALKSKVVNAPEVLAVLHEIPHLGDLLNSLYASNYATFFSALAALVDRMKLDPYLAPHARFFCREMRIKAYSQMLQSYRSVTATSMAAAFGVTPDFLDRELSRFIAAGRLHCKIDKVHGIVETTRPDAKNQLYQNTLRQGDLLLNRIQKLSRVINL